MISFKFLLSKLKKKAVQKALVRAEENGDLVKVKRLLTLLLLHAGHVVSEVSELLQVSDQAVRDWIKKYMLNGLWGLRSGKSPGRPPKLTKTQRRELIRLIALGPELCGFSGACWRTPMIQHLIQEKFGVFYNAHYISELLGNLGFSYQKAAFVASSRDEEAREKWIKNEWPTILKLAQKKNAYILFGDEASFPQWGSLSYTWAPIGQQPIVQTSGTRRGYKVFGVIDYFTGRFFSKGHEGKLNSDSYIAFLEEVLSKTRKHLILIQDGAPYHKGKKMREFFEKNNDRLTVFKLPSYSPDYNPIEKLWKKIKEKGVHMKYFPTFDDLKSKVNDMLDVFDDAKNEVLSLFGFYNELSA
jgi:transposase